MASSSIASSSGATSTHQQDDEIVFIHHKTGARAKRSRQDNPASLTSRPRTDKGKERATPNHRPTRIENEDSDEVVFLFHKNVKPPKRKKRNRDIVIERTNCDKDLASEALRASGGDVDVATEHVTQLIAARRSSDERDRAMAEWLFSTSGSHSKQAVADDCCVICLDDEDQSGKVSLVCGHRFHKACIAEQLAARWNGSRMQFTYLGCALCRRPILHPSFDLTADRKLEQIVTHLCIQRALADNVIEGLDALRSTQPDEAGRLALDAMACFECSDCLQPFVAGRAECLAADIVDAGVAPGQGIRCPECAWNIGPTEHKCKVHGASSAVYKCDSCCSIAIWKCGNNNYCDRCHKIAQVPKNFPCPGLGKCSLGKPHPPNQPGVIQKPNVSFVIGCNQCFEANDAAPP
eukprot:m.271380 g.271380  ORF g.271380 m.271380 type:complete len:407 (+) comp94956_c0_seq1:318-1538(+)